MDMGRVKYVHIATLNWSDLLKMQKLVCMLNMSTEVSKSETCINWFLLARKSTALERQNGMATAHHWFISQLLTPPRPMYDIRYCSKPVPGLLNSMTSTCSSLWTSIKKNKITATSFHLPFYGSKKTAWYHTRIYCFINIQSFRNLKPSSMWT